MIWGTDRTRMAWDVPRHFRPYFLPHFLPRFPHFLPRFPHFLHRHRHRPHPSSVRQRQRQRRPSPNLILNWIGIWKIFKGIHTYIYAKANSTSLDF